MSGASLPQNGNRIGFWNINFFRKLYDVQKISLSLSENGNTVSFWNAVLSRKLDDVQKNKNVSVNSIMLCPPLSTHGNLVMEALV